MIFVFFILWYISIFLSYILWVWLEVWNYIIVVFVVINFLFFRDIFMFCVLFCYMEYVVMSIFMGLVIGSGN